MKITNFHPKTFRSDKRALSPAISTVIMTSAIIVLILAAMMYSNNYLNASIAENEFVINKQFMLTTALQIDDIAWIIGRAQTIRYSSNYGVVNFQDNVLSYKFEVETGGIWQEVFTNETGVIMFDTITTNSLLGNYHFENISSSGRSFNQTGSSAPVANVFAVERGTATGQNEARIVIVPTVRMMNSTIGSQTYVKFFLPLLQKGTIAQSIQSVTLVGQPVSKYVFDHVDAVRFTVDFPAQSRGYNSDFFKFEGDTVTIPLDSDSVVDFYLGEVTVSLGLYT